MISSCFSEEQHDQIKDTISSGNVSVFYARTYKMLYDLLISSEWGFSPKMKSTTLFSWTQSENVLKSKNLAYSCLATYSPVDSSSSCSVLSPK